jgi:hypothetical protein
MCTVSWVHQHGGYHLLCNRDEKRTRGVASPPAVSMRGGVRIIAPGDADFGGTWLATNEFGLSVCLLNGDAGVVPCLPPRRRSRGLLLRDLSWASSTSECTLWLRQLDLGLFAPFVLLALEPAQSAILAKWDGLRLTVDPAGDAHMPLTSSSYDPQAVRISRLNEFSRRIQSAEAANPALLYWFHSSHGTSADAYSPCMHRDDAETVSFSWIIVTPREIRFLYSPAAPCRCAPSKLQVLARVA